MVVVSGSFIKNVVTIPNSIISKMDQIIDSDKPKAVLICRQNSHPFSERTLILDQPVKVGRSVARARASGNNAIFDCKVLSRNHAVLRYENGKFYLQDTKSSNGTFVNNTKLAPESECFEVSSGDIVQFGVDVVENNRKVTHGCIVATIKLYLPDGKEAKASPSISEGMVPLDELYKLNQIIQEATQREQCLENKLSNLHAVVEEARRASDNTWAAYVGEERLLSRISTLENQLLQATKNWSEEKYRQEFMKLQDESLAYQTTAKEALEKLHNEKFEILATAADLQNSKDAAEQEANMAHAHAQIAQEQLQDVVKKLSEQQKKYEEEEVKYETNLESAENELQEKRDNLKELELKLLNLEAKLFKLESMGLLTDIKIKENLDEFAENEEQERLNKTNGEESQTNHITLTVVPVSEIHYQNEEIDDDSILKEKIEDSDIVSCLKKENSNVKIEENKKDVRFKLSSEVNERTKENSFEDTKSGDDLSDGDKDDTEPEAADCKTLKYQYKSAQNELNKKIDALEAIRSSNLKKIAELEIELADERDSNLKTREQNDALRDELIVLKQELKETHNEGQQLRDKLKNINQSNRAESKTLNASESSSTIYVDTDSLTTPCQDRLDGSTTKNSSNGKISYEELVAVEEELVLLKEQYAQVSEEKSKLQRDVASLTDRYHALCDRSYNMTFFYVAPLVLIVLYLLIGKMFS